jgi:DNA polymerase V
MYLPGYLFIKAGVILVDLQSADLQQSELNLEDAPPDERDRSRLMVAMDAINGRYGKGTVESAATGRTGPQRLWEMKQERKTPQYTTPLCQYDLRHLPLINQ